MWNVDVWREGVCVWGGGEGAGGQINWSHVIHTQVIYAAGRGILLPLLMLVVPTREAQLVQKDSRDPHAGAILSGGSGSNLWHWLLQREAWS